MSKETNFQLALELINAIRNELALGTKHYNSKGELLTDEKQIIECLINEGTVTLQAKGE